MHLFLCYFSYVMALSGLIKAFDDIQFVQQFLKRVLFEKIMLAHSFLDIGKKYQRHELDEDLALEVFFR